MTSDYEDDDNDDDNEIESACPTRSTVRWFNGKYQLMLCVLLYV